MGSLRSPRSFAYRRLVALRREPTPCCLDSVATIRFFVVQTDLTTIMLRCNRKDGLSKMALCPSGAMVRLPSTVIRGAGHRINDTSNAEVRLYVYRCCTKVGISQWSASLFRAERLPTRPDAEIPARVHSRNERVPIQHHHAINANGAAQPIHRPVHTVSHY